MTHGISFQEALAGFSRHNFIGRTEQLALFERNLTARKPLFLIMAVSGQGGVGKSTLLKQLRRIAEDHQRLTALVNEDQVGVPATLAALAGQLAEAGQPCPTFDERYHTYREMRQEVEADPQAPTGLWDFALRSAAKITMKSLRRVPIAGEAAEVLLTEEAENVVAEQASLAAAYLAQKFKNKTDRRLLEETEAALTGYFLSDLNKISARQPVILFFDTYEKTAPYLDGWLRHLLRGTFGEFSAHTSFVIAGRYPLGQAWTFAQNAIQPVELQPFTETEARDYLAGAGITDEAQIAEMLKLSERLPVLLALLTATPGGIDLEVAGDAVERFLQGATSAQREMALAASIPRFFNRDILAVVLDEAAIDAAFDWLSGTEFVRAGADSWRYHDVVRPLMQRYLRHRSPAQFERLHSQMAAYYQDKLAPFTETQRDDDTWRTYETERAYHHLSQNPTLHLTETLAAYLEYFEDGGEALRRAYAELVAQVGYETQSANTETWGQRLEHLIAPFEDELDEAAAKEAIAAASALCALGIEQVGFKGIAYFTRGRLYYRIKDNTAALVDFDKSVELQPENSSNYYSRGMTYYRLGNYEAALTNFNEAVELQPENDAHYRWRGMAHYRLGNYEVALSDLDKAVELLPEGSYNYHWQGIVHHHLENYEIALANFDKAVELRMENGPHYNWRGRIQHQLKNYEAALTDFDKAVELQPEEGWNHHRRGRVHYELKNYEVALAAFDKAVVLMPKSGANYYWRGRVYYRLENYEAALSDLNKAIEINPKKLSRYAWRGPWPLMNRIKRRPTLTT